MGTKGAPPGHPPPPTPVTPPSPPKGASGRVEGRGGGQTRGVAPPPPEGHAHSQHRGVRHPFVLRASAIASSAQVEPPSSPTAKKVASDSPVQVTEKSEKALDGPVYEQQEGRPKWREILTAEGRGSDCAVLCCGPAPMVTEVQRLAYELQTPFHAETFAF